MSTAIRVWSCIMLIMQAWGLHYDAAGVNTHYLISQEVDIMLDIALIIFWAYMVFKDSNNNKVKYD